MSQVTNFEIPGSPLSMATLAETLEDDFAAVASLNRGTSAPSNPFAGMCWNDTSASPVISIRIYSATYGWVTLATYNDTTGAVLSFGGRTIGGTSAGDILDNNSSQTATNKRFTGPRLNEDVALGSTSTEIDRLCDDATATAAEVSQLHNQGALAADFAKLHAITKSAAQIDSNMPEVVPSYTAPTTSTDLDTDGTIIATRSLGTLQAGDIFLVVGSFTGEKGATAGKTALRVHCAGTAAFYQDAFINTAWDGAGNYTSKEVAGLFIVQTGGTATVYLTGFSEGSDAQVFSGYGLSTVFLRKQ